MDRQQLESGNELLTVTGRVINPTGKEQPVPPLQAQLKNRSRQGGLQLDDRAAGADRSPPGASASFNSAEVSVPPGGDELTITLGGPGQAAKLLNSISLAGWTVPSAVLIDGSRGGGAPGLSAAVQLEPHCRNDPDGRGRLHDCRRRTWVARRAMRRCGGGRTEHGVHDVTRSRAKW